MSEQLLCFCCQGQCGPGANRVAELFPVATKRARYDTTSRKHAAGGFRQPIASYSRRAGGDGAAVAAPSAPSAPEPSRLVASRRRTGLGIGGGGSGSNGGANGGAISSKSAPTYGNGNALVVIYRIRTRSQRRTGRGHYSRRSYDWRIAQELQPQAGIRRPLDRDSTHARSFDCQGRSAGHSAARAGRTRTGVLGSFRVRHESPVFDLLARRLEHTDAPRHLGPVRNTYCGSDSAQFMHIDDLEIREWLQRRMEESQNRLKLSRDEQIRILPRN